MTNEALSQTFEIHPDARARHDMLRQMLERPASEDDEVRSATDASATLDAVSVAWVDYATSREAVPSWA